MGSISSKMEAPLVSVVMPAYNMEGYIAESIESVLASDYQNIELVVVDDGSKDATHSIAQKYQAKDSRVKALTKANGGQGCARNFGVQHCSGKYLLLVDSDDLIGRSYISQAVEVMERDSSVEVVTCRGEFFDGRTGSWRLKPYTPATLAKRNVFTISSLMRRESYLRVGGFDDSMHNYCEDWAFWIALLKDGGNVVTLPTVEFYYRVRSGSSRFVGRKYKGELISTLNRKFPDFFERELGGRLHSQRSLSPLLNRLHRLFCPLTVAAADRFSHLEYYLCALPRIAGSAPRCTATWQGVDVQIIRTTNPRSAAQQFGDRVVGYCTERRFWVFSRSWIAYLP